MRKAMLAICTLLAISSFAIAQTNSSTSTSSSGMQSTASSSSFSCPCHTTQTSAENSINQLHKECKEKNGEDSFSMKKMSENCFCIEGACDIHYSSASIDTISYSSSSSSIVISSSSEYIYTGGVCYIDSVYYEGVKNVPTVHRGLYSVLPYMKNADNIKVSKCSCNQDGSFKCNYSNFGVPIGYKPIDIPLCGLRNAYWCPGIDDGMCDYSGSSIEIYHSDQYWKTDYTWGVKNFSNNGVFEINDGSQPLYVVTTDNERYLFFWMNRPLPQNINTFDLEDAFLKANPRFPSVDKMNEYCRGEWFPHDEDCFGYASEVEIALQDSIDNCALSMGISKYDTTLSDRGWCVVGTCEPGEDPYYSSSSYASSSSSEESSSSSEFGLCQSLPFSYIPSDPKNTCFESNGKCYRCNAARRADECDEEWMWIYPYTPDKYFFTEIDCISGERKDNNRIGQCPGFPMETTPYNPEQACIAHNGKCYRCKSENSYVNCSYDWLWTGENFGTHNIGSWYEEVDCYDPFEENNNEFVVNGCVDESVLRKQAAKDYYRQYEDPSIEYFVDFTKPTKKFDILGRHRINKQPSHMALYQKNMAKPQREIETSAILQIPSISSADYCDRDSSGSWNCNKNKKVLEKRVWSVNEFVDPRRCDVKKGRDYWYFKEKTDPETGEIVKTYFGGVTCAWPNVSINHEPISQENELIYSNGKIVGAKATVKYRFYTHTTLGENNYIIMKAGEAFSDGHVVTPAEETCYEKHEQGHEKYNECVSYEEVEETGTFECTVKVSGTMSKEKRTEILNDAVTADLTVKRDLFEKQHWQDRLNKAQKKLDKSRDLFHADFGTDGYAGKNDKLPKSYVCPNF